MQFQTPSRHNHSVHESYRATQMGMPYRSNPGWGQHGTPTLLTETQPPNTATALLGSTAAKLPAAGRPSCLMFEQCCSQCVARSQLCIIRDGEGPDVQGSTSPARCRQRVSDAPAH